MMTLADHHPPPSQGLTELQTKLANLVLGLKSDPNELDALGGDGGAALPPANGTAAAAQPAPRATGWGQDASFSGWGGTAGTPSGGGGSGASGGWGTSPGGTGWVGSSGSGTSPSAGAWGNNAASNAWGAGGGSWGTGSSPAQNTGYSSPNPQTQSGWNV